MKKILLSLLVLASTSNVFAELAVPQEVASLHKTLCSDIEEDQIYVESMDLGHGKKLYLLTCELYAYNQSVRGYITSSYAALEPLSIVEIDTNGKFSATTNLMGAELDQETKSISTFQKGRGIGDCGSSATYVYDSEIEQFTLKEYRLKNECDGEFEAEWPIIFPKN